MKNRPADVAQAIHGFANYRPARMASVSNDADAQREAG